MADTYCGKLCEECSRFLDDSCGGCRTGVYRPDCEIAKCSASKGHENCSSCSFALTCRTRLTRDQMPQLLIDRQRREEELRIERMAKAEVLGKWLWPIFWAWVVQVVLNLVLGNSLVTENLPVLGHIGTGLGWIACLFTAYCYWQMQGVDDRFRFVAAFWVVNIAYEAVNEFFPDVEVLGILVGLPFAVLAFMSEYRECMAYSDALAGVHNEWSEKWQKQWAQYKFILIGAGISILCLIIPIVNVIAAIAVFGFVIMLLVVSFRKMVYIYRTADLFRAFPGK